MTGVKMGREDVGMRWAGCLNILINGPMSPSHGSEAQTVTTLLTGIMRFSHERRGLGRTASLADKTKSRLPAGSVVRALFEAEVYFFGGLGQFAWLPVPSFAPLPGAESLPDPSRTGVPVELGLPRLLMDLPDPSWAGTDWVQSRLPPRPPPPLPPPPREPAARAEVPARRPALIREVRMMIFVFMGLFPFNKVQPRLAHACYSND